MDLAADLRASTPSNAAELITRDRQAVAHQLRSEMLRTSQNLLERIRYEREQNLHKIERLGTTLVTKYIDPMLTDNQTKLTQILQQIHNRWQELSNHLQQKQQILVALNPEKILEQGYAIVKGQISVDNVVEITTFKQQIKAQIKEVHVRN